MKDKDIRLYGDLEIHMAARQVLRGGVRVELPDLTSRLFFALVAASPEPRSHEALANSVWNGSYVSDETIAQRVKLLRQALGDTARDARYIETVRGRGYRLVPPRRYDRHPGKWVVVAGVATVLAVATSAAVFLAHEDAAPPAEVSAPAGEAGLTLMLAQAEHYLTSRRADDIEAAIKLFRTALERWPDENQSRVGLSFALSTRSTKISGSESDAEEAEALARHVVGREAGNEEAWHALAYALDAQGRVDDAITAYLRAHELAPEKPSAASSAAYLLAIRGRFYDALKLEVAVLGGRAQSRYADTQIAEALDLLGYDAASARWRRKALMLNPGDAVVAGGAAVAALRAGDSASARELIASLPTDVRATARLRQISGHVYLAERQLEAAQSAFEDNDALLYAATTALIDGETPAPTNAGALDSVTWPGQYVDEAAYLAASGQTAAALRSLDHAVDLGWRDYRQLERLPFFAPLRQDSALAVIIARIREDIAFQRKLLESDDALMRALGLEGAAD